MYANVGTKPNIVSVWGHYGNWWSHCRIWWMATLNRYSCFRTRKLVPSIWNELSGHYRDSALLCGSHATLFSEFKAVNSCFQVLQRISKLWWRCHYFCHTLWFLIICNSYEVSIIYLLLMPQHSGRVVSFLWEREKCSYLSFGCVFLSLLICRLFYITI